MILITGVNGFIGTNLSIFLKRKNIKYIGIDKKKSIYGIKHKYFFNISTSQLKKNKFLFRKVNTIIHLAAEGNIAKSLINPKKNIISNISSTIEVINFAKISNIKKIIFSSTGGAIYGNEIKIPANENILPRPISPYAVSKMCCEEIIKMESRLSDIDYIILRFANVFGPYAIHKQNFFINAILSILKKDRVLKIFGNLNKKRDFIHVDTICKTIVNLIKLKKKNETYNLSTGKSISLKKVINILENYKKKKCILNFTRAEKVKFETHLLVIAK